MCIRLENISKAYHDLTVFKECNVSFVNNGLYFISGKSGSGKSTLLNIIAGYEKIDNGERIVESDLTISMLFQNFELIDDFHVKKNIYLYNELYGSSNEMDMIINDLGISHLLESYPKELSHGQKQRVALARSLNCESDVILCDEPTESLDKKNKDVVMKLLKKLSRNHIIIVVSHDEELLSEYYDIKYEINEGKINLIENRNEQCQHIVQPKKHYNKNALIKVLKQLSLKRKKLFYVFMTLFIIASILFSITYVSLNQINRRSLNDHVIYMKATNTDGTPSTYGQPDLIRPQYNLGDYVTFNNQKVYLSVLSIPYEYDELPLLEGKYDDEGIIINQFVADELRTVLGKDDILGEEIQLYFKSGVVKTFTFHISAIIEEDEQLKCMNLYYPYDIIDDYLKNTYFSNSNITLYDQYMSKYVTYYEAIYSLDKDILDIYSYMKNHNYRCTSQVLELQNFYTYHSQMIAFIILSLTILFTLSSFLFIVIYNYMDIKKKNTSMIVIHSLGIPIHQIRFLYSLINSLLFICLLMIIFITFIMTSPLIMIIISSMLSFTCQPHYLIIIPIMIAYILIYILSQYIIQKINNKKTMISLMKEE